MRLRTWAVGLIVGAFGLTVGLNWRGLGDGLLYLRDMLAYRPAPSATVSPTGRFGAVYDLIAPHRNAARDFYIGAWLGERGLNPERIPITGSSQGNWLVRLGPPGPVTLFAAHWDILTERPTYQGASDNTAAVAVLLAAAETLSRETLSFPVAFLWTGEEERGLRGSAEFVRWARANDFQVHEVWNFDSLGRGGLTARPMAPIPGFVFRIPLVGWYVYDGRAMRRTEPHPPLDPVVVQTLRAVEPPVHIAHAMAASGDTVEFDKAGWRGAMLSASDIHYLDLTWHNDHDRVELLDETHLDLAYRLILNLALRLTR